MFNSYLFVGESCIFIYLINHYSYSNYPVYDERLHLHVGYSSPEPVSAPSSPEVRRRRKKENKLAKNNCHFFTPLAALIALLYPPPLPVTYQLTLEDMRCVLHSPQLLLSLSFLPMNFNHAPNGPLSVTV